MTLSLYRSPISNQAADAFNAGMFILRVSTSSAALLHEIWHDWRFDQLIALWSKVPSNQHKYDQVEQGAMQHRIISGNVRNQLLMQATVHPWLRSRTDISFGCQDYYKVNIPNEINLNTLLQKDYSSSANNIDGTYPTDFPPWISTIEPNVQQYYRRMPSISCTPIPLNRVRVFSQASINSFPSSWEWYSDRTRKYDWIAHPAGDAWKEERVQSYVENLQEFYKLKTVHNNNNNNENTDVKDTIYPSKDVHDILPHWMFWF